MTTTETKQSHKQQDAIARAYILAMKAGQKPVERPDISEHWEIMVVLVEEAYTKYGAMAGAMELIIEGHCKTYPALADLLKPTTGPLQGGDESSFPELPDDIRKIEALGKDACPWLDEYIAFSKEWSPRGYESYHEASALALLSTVAGRRVAFPFGQMEYTPLFIALVGFTTLFKKTTTTNIYYGLLHASDLDWMLGANITTPQKLLSDMAGRTVPTNYSKLMLEEQEHVRKALARAAQRGWYYDEFGQHLDQMVQEKGTMADFKGLLRLLDDCKPTFSTATQTRGHERVDKPYLSLLASLTPADIKPHAQKNHKFWRDGLFARFAFVVAHRNVKGKRDRFPTKWITYPAALVDPLKEWNTWLGEAEVIITEGVDKQDNPNGDFTIERLKELPERVCVADDDLLDAIYGYEGALIDLVESQKIPEAFFGSYGRLHKIALRVAMLLASFEARGNTQEGYGGQIKMRHWARGQAFAEARRRDLHELYAQVNSDDPGIESPRATTEDLIVKHLRKHGALTLNTLRTSYMKGRSVEELEKALRGLKRAGITTDFATYGTTKYALDEGNLKD